MGFMLPCSRDLLAPNLWFFAAGKWNRLCARVWEYRLQGTSVPGNLDQELVLGSQSRQQSEPPQCLPFGYPVGSCKGRGVFTRLWNDLARGLPVKLEDAFCVSSGNGK